MIHTAKVIEGEVVEGYEGWTDDDFVGRWIELDRVEEDTIWGRADIAAARVKKYGKDTLGQFASRVGASRRTVQQMAQTSRAYREKRGRPRFWVAFELRNEDDKYELAQQDMTQAEARALVKQRKEGSRLNP